MDECLMIEPRTIQISLTIDYGVHDMLVTDRVVAILRELAADSVRNTIGFSRDYPDSNSWTAEDGKSGWLKTKWGRADWIVLGSPLGKGAAS